MRRFDPQQIAERRLQFERFAEWEAQQQVAAGPPDSQTVRQAIQWYGEALELATRQGAAGRGAPETHLDALIQWVRRWRAAWRAE